MEIGEMTDTAMTKGEILTRLHQIAADRLFGREWLADWEACVALQAMLINMGLQEKFPGPPTEWRNTPLGKELQVELFEVFMGLYAASEMPMILVHHGLLDEPDESARGESILDESASALDEIWPIAWSAEEDKACAAKLQERMRHIYLKFCNAERGLN
jgi:hypothetical protein